MFRSDPETAPLWHLGKSRDAERNTESIQELSRGNEGTEHHRGRFRKRMSEGNQHTARGSFLNDVGGTANETMNDANGFSRHDTEDPS